MTALSCASDVRTVVITTDGIQGQDVGAFGVCSSPFPSVDLDGHAPFTALNETHGNNGNGDEMATDELPPLPDSTALFFCGLGSLGALKLTHSMRKLHFGHLPQWYHDGAPRQIGHAFALEFDANSLPIWSVVHLPTVQMPELSIPLCPVRQRLIRPLLCLTSSDPRAPPTVSL